MNIKPGATWGSDMKPSMWYARCVTGQLYREWTEGQEGTITSGKRPKSVGGSGLHPKGEALDLRVWFWGGSAPTPGQVSDLRAFAAELRVRLGPDFDVVIEGPAAEFEKYRKRPPHIHIEHDPE